MYGIDDRDVVTPATIAPRPDAGAPMPVLLASDHDLLLGYGTATGEFALLRFPHPRAHLFGPPNDEALHGHPLYSRGLRPYGIHEVTNSSWIRALERMNGVHPCHRPERFLALRHFVFAFHDTCFECVAEDVPEVEVLADDGEAMIEAMLARSRR